MLASAIILGFIGSLHCIGMCGPIAFVLPVDRKRPVRRFFQVSSYHLGRIVTYGSIGLLFGIFGSGLKVFGLQQGLSIAIGVIMILLIVLPSKWLGRYGPGRLMYRSVSVLKGKFGSLFKKRTIAGFFTIGFLNGLLPCGLVYVAVLGAIASDSVLAGGGYMALFGVGTIPMMTVAVYAGNFLKGDKISRLRKLIPIAVVIIGCLFILRGMGLGIPYVSPSSPGQEVVDSNMECH